MNLFLAGIAVGAVGILALIFGLLYRGYKMQPEPGPVPYEQRAKWGQE
jgi:hypothetical protein